MTHKLKSEKVRVRCNLTEEGMERINRMTSVGKHHILIKDCTNFSLAFFIFIESHKLCSVGICFNLCYHFNDITYFGVKFA